MKTTSFLSAFALSAGLSQAAVIQFDLLGKGGPGLLSTNQTTVINGIPGSGGEVGAGITYDDVTKILTVNVAWGTGNGFDDLSGTATAGHIHGVTASAAPASFNEAAAVLINLDGPPLTWDPSASGGSIHGDVNLAANEAALLNGSLYINVHTAANGGGEIRGNLIQAPVPEPATGLLGVLGFVAIGLRRRAV